jgi:hypothetical protein
MPHQLEVVLETWVAFLDFCMVKKTIAAQGLQCFLAGMEPTCSTIEDMFLASPDFGLTIMLTSDSPLQNFYETVAVAHNISRLPPSDW